MDHTMVHPELIRTAGHGIQSAADQARTHLERFQQELDSYGDPWGDDDVGSAIGLCYGVIAGLAMDCYQTNVDGLTGFGEGVTTMADNYQQTEDQNTAGFARLHESLG
jgi:hypothetical protein